MTNQKGGDETPVCVGDLRPVDASHLLKMGKYVSGDGAESSDDKEEDEWEDAKRNETILKKLNAREPVTERRSPRYSNKPSDQSSCLPPKKRKCVSHKHDEGQGGKVSTKDCLPDEGEDESKEDTRKSEAEGATKLTPSVMGSAGGGGKHSTCWAVQALSSDQHRVNESIESKKRTSERGDEEGGR